MNADEVVRALRQLSDALGRQPTDWPTGEDTCWEALDLIESLQAQLAESQRRADAAIKDMKYYIGRVLSPKYGNYACCICKHVDNDCGMLVGCNGLNHWEWRG